jgi:hypothetical protein
MNPVLSIAWGIGYKRTPFMLLSCTFMNIICVLTECIYCRAFYCVDKTHLIVEDSPRVLCRARASVHFGKVRMFLGV